MVATMTQQKGAVPSSCDQVRANVQRSSAMTTIRYQSVPTRETRSGKQSKLKKEALNFTSLQIRRVRPQTTTRTCVKTPAAALTMTMAMQEKEKANHQRFAQVSSTRSPRKLVLPTNATGLADEWPIACREIWQLPISIPIFNVSACMRSACSRHGAFVNSIATLKMNAKFKPSFQSEHLIVYLHSVHPGWEG